MPLVGDLDDDEDEAELGRNSIDNMNFGYETGRETGPSSGTNSVIGRR